jgi:NTE family protein
LIGGGLEYKFLKIKSETLANMDLIDRTTLSKLGHMKYDSFDDKYFPKRLVFWGYSVPFVVVTMNLILFHRKGDLVAAIIF